MRKGRIRRAAAEASLWFGVPLVAAFGLVWAIRMRADLGAVALGAATLLVTAITLYNVVPQPARLLVFDQPELEYTDLIFYVYPQPAQPSEIQVPRDFVVQVHVAVTNVGGRKAVLSKLKLMAFLSASGDECRLPDVPMPLEGRLFTTRQTSSFPTGVDFRTEERPPPFVLDPDDVITLRFRSRRGVDWGNPKWTPSSLEQFADALATPISMARVLATYRSRDKLISDEFVVPVSVSQQDLYVELLHSLTAEFTETPDIAPLHIQFE